MAPQNPAIQEVSSPALGQRQLRLGLGAFDLNVGIKVLSFHSCVGFLDGDPSGELTEKMWLYMG